MRHWLRLALCGGALAALLTCGAAATDDYTTDANGGTVDYDSASGVYTASYNGTTSGNQYAILVVKYDGEDTSDYSISEDTIMYIDQKAATDTGVSFDFIPRSTPDCVVLLGGEFDGAESPVVLGTLVGKGVTVSGSVKYQGSSSQATVSLTDKATGEVLYSTQTDTNGAYSFDSVALGEYNLFVTKKSYLTYTRAIEIAEEAILDEVDITKLAGDINASGKVNSEDLTTLLRNFNGEDESADINGTGKVNSEDLSALLSSFNAENYEE